MASVLKTKNWMKYRRFWFNPDAFNQGREWVRECLMQETQIIVIDEVGPMEPVSYTHLTLADDRRGV